MTTTMSPASLSDATLLAETVRAAGAERRAAAELIALLAEVDARRLYLGQGDPSLFAWCTSVLRLSESAAYGRITAARAARRYPLILTRLATGDVTLTTITLLAAHLTDDHHESLLERSRCAAARRPRATPPGRAAGRHVSAAVRRAVWQRDERRCACVGADGRCPETGWLELHHVVPFARGGPTTVENLELRCRAHNAYEAALAFGEKVPHAHQRDARGRRAVRAPDSVRTESDDEARHQSHRIAAGGLLVRP